MIVGEILNDKIKTKFVPLDETYFESKEIDISSCSSYEDIIETLNNVSKDNTYYRILLTGIRNFEINTNKIQSLLTNETILKIHDNTENSFDLDTLKTQSSLKGIFVKNMLQKLENEPENAEQIKKALEIGLMSLE